MKANQNNFIPKTVIPHYVIDYSINYNQYILPIYLFLKQRVNIDKQIYFSYKALLEFFNNDRFTEKNEKDIISAIIFLLQGVEILKDNKSKDKELLLNIFQVTDEENILLNLLSNVTLQESKQEQTLELISNNKKYTIDNIIKLIVEFLSNHNNILLYDNTIENTIGYISIKNSTLQYILWYYNHQTNNFNRITQKYTLKYQDKLINLKKEYNIKEGKTNPTKISYITLINMYIYIYKLYTINQSFNQQTTVSISTLSKKLSASNTTIKLYSDILVDIKLLQITTGKFKEKSITAYYIIDDYEKNYINIKDFEVYRYSLVSKDNFKNILNCYTKESTQQIKRSRGRPKKNNIL